MQRSALCFSRLCLRSTSRLFRPGVRFYGSYNSKSPRFECNKNVIWAVSLWAAFKHYTGWEPIQLDDDPLADAIKKSWVLRKHRRYDEAVEILHFALRKVVEQNHQFAITRIEDELANTFLEMGKLDEADRLFRSVCSRLLQVHGKSDSSHEFIGASLKLAGIFALKGDGQSAESGYKHCLEKQINLVDSIITEDIYPIAGKSLETLRVGMDDKVIPDRKYFETLAQYGMVSEEYAHFLLKCDQSREEESVELISKAVELSSMIFGSNHEQTVTIMNNYAVQALRAKRFALAERFLKVVVEKAQNVPGLSDRLPGYVTNYSEALFHNGNKQEAQKQAHRAAELSQASSEVDPLIRDHSRKFAKELDAEVKGKSGWSFW